MNIKKYHYVNNLGKIIKEHRLALGITQEKLSEILGICPVYMSYLETGKRTPSLDLLFRICENLSIDIKELFEKNVNKN